MNKWNESVDHIMLEDLHHIATGDAPLLQLANQTVLVTGATGMLGSQLIMTLLYCNDLKHTNIKVFALIRNQEKAKRIFKNLYNHKSISFIVGDIQSLDWLPDSIDYIVHGASVTSSKDFITKPVDTINTALVGSINLFEWVKNKKIKSMVYLSSLEVYGVTDSTKQRIGEEDYGYIDPLNVRSSYSEGKRMVECMGVAYASQYNIPIKIARLCQTFGAGVDYGDSRVYSEFGRCIIEERNIILHTKGETVRNYCYTRDAIRAILYILLSGDNGTAYNVANMNTAISIRDMAQLLVDNFSDTNIRLEYDIADEQSFGYNPTVKIELNTERLQGLGWKAEVDLIEMYQRMIQSMLERSIS